MAALPHRVTSANAKAEVLRTSIATSWAATGSTATARIAVPARTVTRETELEAFLEVWHEHPPAELAAARWGKPLR